MGFDVDRAKVDQLLAGRSYIKHIPAEWIARYVADGRFLPTADMRRLGEPDALLICVPTPLNDTRDPDRPLSADGPDESPPPCGRGKFIRPREYDLSRHHAGSRPADPAEKVHIIIAARPRSHHQRAIAVLILHTVDQPTPPTNTHTSQPHTHTPRTCTAH